MTGVTRQRVTRRCGATQVVHGIALAVSDCEFWVLLGRSGCGTSTILRMIAGLEVTTGGALRIGHGDGTRDDPGQRGVAMVFQT